MKSAPTSDLVVREGAGRLCCVNGGGVADVAPTNGQNMGACVGSCSDE
jgi:hypothetical protein